MSLSLSHWYPGSGVVLDCINSLSLHPYELYFLTIWFLLIHDAMLDKDLKLHEGLDGGSGIHYSLKI